MTSLRAYSEILEDLRDPRERCFLCGKRPPEVEITQEHVVPRWAQRRHSLWDRELSLLNGSVIPYRQLTIPCCLWCNGERLKPIEDAMATAVYQGREAVLKLGEQTLFIWLGKLVYGMLYKEATLAANRADPKSEPIVSESVLESHSMHQLLLQQAGGEAQIMAGIPGSIYVFEAQRLPNASWEWDYQDYADRLVVGCRIGATAMVADLADCGLLHQYQMFEECVALELHPLQFRQLLATAAYISTLRTSVGKYLIGGTNPVRIWQVPRVSAPNLQEWDHENYATMVAWYLGSDLSKLYTPPDLVWNCLYNSDGSLQHLPFAEAPFLSLRDSD